MEKYGEVRAALERFLNEDLERLILSNPKNRERFIKLTVRPVLLRGKLKFQVEELTQKQAFQKNLDREETLFYLMGQLEELYRNGEAVSSQGTMNLLISKKGTVTLKLRQRARIRSGEGEKAVGNSDQGGDTRGADNSGARFQARLSHNRKKRYVLEEGVPVPFLVDLGVMTKEGVVVKAKFDKFRQINRFLEYIEDVLPQLDRTRENTIVDFGCGKSYLTFAMYYYLKEIRNYPIRIIGLDLKEDVIALCNRLSEKFAFENLHFYCGDIAGYEGVKRVDMVVTLHACDTATDYALEKAVRWNARVILSVPCCQHELDGQIENDLLRPVLRYGILRERMSALLTDGIRAELLEAAGYRTQILEFIDMEHTPKNLMIRAVRAEDGGTRGSERESGEQKKAERREELERLIRELHAAPTLYRLMGEER